MKKTFLLLALVLLATSGAAAQSIGAPPQTTAITISPIHLLLPVVELTAEFNVAPRMGMAGIAGFGSVTVNDVYNGSTSTMNVLELGASLRYYLVGDFDHGMQLGGEILYAHISGDLNEEVSGLGNGLAIGPFIGYKIAAGFGLTFEAQGGVQYMLATARAEQTSTGQSGTASAGGIVPLINLNVGWSF
jgi:hypothetical protein